MGAIEERTTGTAHDRCHGNDALLATSHLVQADDLPLFQYCPLASGNRWVYEVQDRIDGAPSSEEYWEVTREERGAFVPRSRLSDLTTGSFKESLISTNKDVKRFACEAGDKERPTFFLRGPCRRERCGETKMASMKSLKMIK